MAGESDAVTGMSTLRHRILALREVGMTDRRLAIKARVAAETISDIVEGQRKVRASTEQVVDQALREFELPLRDHLIAIHGLPGI